MRQIRPCAGCALMGRAPVQLGWHSPIGVALPARLCRRSSIGAAATYVFCYYNVHVAGINAVVWGLLAGAILYFAVGKATSKNGLDADIIKNCF